MFRSHFGGEHGDNDRGSADSDSTDNPSRIESADRMRVHNLKDPANLENQGRGDDSPSSPKALSKGPHHEAPEERAGLQNADTVRADLGGSLARIAEISLERRKSEYAANNACVISEEE